MVRLAHSADLRSRLRHVSSAPSVAYSTVKGRNSTSRGCSVVLFLKFTETTLRKR